MLFHKCRCGTLIPQNIKECEACAKAEHGSSRHMEYNRYRRDRKAAAFYVSVEWRKARAEAFRLCDGIDLYAYYIRHEIQMADMVHHIVPLEADWNRRCKQDNLIPLSNHSHGIIEALYKKDERTKKETQKLLLELKDRYQKEVGEYKKV